MANNSESHGGLYFVVGAIAVVVLIVVIVLFGGVPSGGGDRAGQSVDVEVEAPKTPSAGAEAPKVPDSGLGSGTSNTANPPSPAR